MNAVKISSVSYYTLSACKKIPLNQMFSFYYCPISQY